MEKEGYRRNHNTVKKGLENLWFKECGPNKEVVIMMEGMKRKEEKDRECKGGLDWKGVW